jgi:hypothetical protein
LLATTSKSKRFRCETTRPCRKHNKKTPKQHPSDDPTRDKKQNN